MKIEDVSAGYMKKEDVSAGYMKIEDVSAGYMKNEDVSAGYMKNEDVSAGYMKIEDVSTRYIEKSEYEQAVQKLNKAKTDNADRVSEIKKLRLNYDRALRDLETAATTHETKVKGLETAITVLENVDKRNTYLKESELYFSLRNLPKAKAALTDAGTAANDIDVPLAQQGTIDLQWGILHAEEKDYNTAYSFFLKALEAFNALEDPRAIFSLKYMLLCKIMVNKADDVAVIISSKADLQYVGVNLDAMKAVADAHSKRSLKLIKTALRDYKAQLEEDPIVHRHLSSLYDTLLEQKLCSLIEPLSSVETDHIAKLIELPVKHVEKKLSQMILNKKFAGVLDPVAGSLTIFDEPKADPAILEMINNLGNVVDGLYQRSANMQR